MIATLQALAAQAPLMTPLLLFAGAILALISPGPRVAAAIGLGATLLVAALGLDLAHALLFEAAGPLYGLEPAASGRASFAGDAFSGYAAAFLAAAQPFLFAAGAGALAARAPAGKMRLALALMLAGYGCAWGAMAAGDVLTLWAWFTGAALAGAGLTGLFADRASALSAALRQTQVASLAVAIALIGAALAARGAGAARFDVVAAAAADPIVSAGLGLQLVGYAALAGLAPLGGWTRMSWSRGASAAGAGFAVLFAAAAAMAAVRIAGLGGAAGFSSIVVALGAASLAIGVWQAIAAADLRRVAAGAWTAQLGAAFLGLAAAETGGEAAALFHLTASALAVGLLLVALAGIEPAGTAGLGRRKPFLGAAVTLALLSLLGAPLTMGFLGKWLLVAAAIAAGQWPAAAAILIGAFASVLFAGRALERLYLAGTNQPPGPPAPMMGPGLAAPALAAFAFALLWWGIDASWPLSAAQAGALAEWGAIR
jgi:multicomponent Na+:H+ antiporter subunit D